MAPNHQVIWIMKPTDRPSCVCDGLWIISSFESKEEEEERRHKERKREKLQLRAECWIQLWFSLRPYREIITRPLRNIKTKKKKRISRERSRRSIKFFFLPSSFPLFLSPALSIAPETKCQNWAAAVAVAVAASPSRNPDPARHHQKYYLFFFWFKRGKPWKRISRSFSVLFLYRQWKREKKRRGFFLFRFLSTERAPPATERARKQFLI